MQNNRGSVIAVDYYRRSRGVSTISPWDIAWSWDGRVPDVMPSALREQRWRMRRTTVISAMPKLTAANGNCSLPGKRRRIAPADNEWQSRDACDCMCIKQESVTSVTRLWYSTPEYVTRKMRTWNYRTRLQSTTHSPPELWIRRSWESRVPCRETVAYALHVGIKLWSW